MNKEQFLEILKDIFVEEYILRFKNKELGSCRNLVTAWSVRIISDNPRLRHRQIYKGNALKFLNELLKDGVISHQTYRYKNFIPEEELFKEIEERALKEMGVNKSDLTIGALQAISREFSELKAKEDMLICERERLAAQLQRELNAESKAEKALKKEDD